MQVSFKKIVHLMSATMLLVVSCFGVAMPNAALAQVECATLAVGTKFKVTGVSTVYILNDNKERLFFPNDSVYKTWYGDFSDVVEIDPACVMQYPAPSVLPISVTYRSGSRLVTTPLTSDIYVVMPGRQLAKIASEAAAARLYGPNWAIRVHDVPDLYFSNYAVTDMVLDTESMHNGMLLECDCTEGKKYFVADDDRLREVPLEGMPDFIKADARSITQGVVETYATYSNSGPIYSPIEPRVSSDASQTIIPPEMPNTVEDIPINQYTYSLTNGINDTFSIKYPTHWVTADAADRNEMLESFGVDETADTLVDFVGFTHETHETAALAMVVAESSDATDSDLQGLIDDLHAGTAEQQQAFDALQEFGINLDISDVLGIDVDNTFGRTITMTVEADGKSVMKFEIVEVVRGDIIYYVLFAAISEEDINRFDTVFEYMRDSIEFLS